MNAFARQTVALYSFSDMGQMQLAQMNKKSGVNKNLIVLEIWISIKN